MCRWQVPVWILLLLSGATQARSAIHVTVADDRVSAIADDYLGLSHQQTKTIGSPISTTVTISDGGVSSTATSGLTIVCSTATFVATHASQWPQSGTAKWYTDFNFTLTQTVHYSISGEYAGSLYGADDKLFSQVYLYSYGDHSYPVFERDLHTGSGSFATTFNGVGEGSGYGGGALAGTLTPGDYYFNCTQYTDLFDFSGASSATGSVNLTLVAPSAVPEPSAIAIWSILGLVGFAAYSQRGDRSRLDI